MTYVRQFFRFLYDFLVGDAWELFVGPLVALFVAWLLVQQGVAPELAGGAVFVAILGVVAAHLVIALRDAA